MLKKRSAGDVVFNASNTLVLAFTILVCGYPFLYIILYSISNPDKVGMSFLIVPLEVTFDSYKHLFLQNRILHAYFISISRTVAGTIGTMFITYMVAYALSKQHLLFRKFFLRFCAVTMYLGAGLIPTYILMNSLGLNGTFWIYVIPGLMDVYSMLIIRIYIEALPPSLEESAYLDGANEVRSAFQIILPLCTPVIAALALFKCVGHWSSYYDTLIYAPTVSNLHTIQYVMYNLINDQFTTTFENVRIRLKANPLSLKMAVTVVTVLPVLFVYPFLQRYFVKGLYLGAVKG
jgi:putative aldouronate transport system permease protein